MYAYALFCDASSCRQFIYIPRDATAPESAFQTIHAHATTSQGWTLTSTGLFHCARHTTQEADPQ